MSITIFYYTGTGNSLWVARTIANELGGATLLSIPAIKEAQNDFNAEIIGIVFPVYIWGVPAPVAKFLKILTEVSPNYVFAVAVNGGQVANTLIQVKNIIATNGLTLSAGFEITMPSNYIPWGGPGPQVKQQKRFELAKEKISQVVVKIKAMEKTAIEKGPLWQRIIFSQILYRLSFSQVPTMDKQFWVDDKCNQCSICQKVCPATNITLHEGKPVWNHRCQQCLACLQWCPKEAIQYGKNTPKYERYHHPEVVLKDILQSR